MANFEAFCWNFSSSINIFFLNSGMVEGIGFVLFSHARPTPKWASWITGEAVQFDHVKKMWPFFKMAWSCRWWWFSGALDAWPLLTFVREYLKLISSLLHWFCWCGVDDNLCIKYAILFFLASIINKLTKIWTKMTIHFCSYFCQFV